MGARPMLTQSYERLEDRILSRLELQLQHAPETHAEVLDNQDVSEMLRRNA